MPPDGEQLATTELPHLLYLRNRTTNDRRYPPLSRSIQPAGLLTPTPSIPQPTFPAPPQTATTPIVVERAGETAAACANAIANRQIKVMPIIGVDHSPSCARMSHLCFNVVYAAMMTKICRLTCHKCEPSPPPPPPPPPPSTPPPLAPSTTPPPRLLPPLSSPATPPATPPGIGNNARTQKLQRSCKFFAAKQASLRAQIVCNSDFSTSERIQHKLFPLKCFLLSTTLQKIIRSRYSMQKNSQHF